MKRSRVLNEQWLINFIDGKISLRRGLVYKTTNDVAYTKIANPLTRKVYRAIYGTTFRRLMNSYILYSVHYCSAHSRSYIGGTKPDDSSIFRNIAMRIHVGIQLRRPCTITFLWINTFDTLTYCNNFGNNLRLSQPLLRAVQMLEVSFAKLVLWNGNGRL